MTEQTVKKPRAPRKKKEVVEETSSPENVRVSVEQILAGIIDHFGKVEVPLEMMVKDFSNKQISVSQDGNTVIFEVVDTPENA